MKISRIIFGSVRVRLRGNAPEECLNLFLARELPFWSIVQTDPGELEVTIFSRDLKRAGELCLQVYCDLQCLSQSGLPQLFCRWIKRPVFLVGILLTLALTFFLQNYVWSVEIKGEDAEIDRRILRILQESGISFGSRGDQIDSQSVKLDMLKQLPELSWLAVNRRGGKLTVLYLLRSDDDDPMKNSPANLVALRDGVITDFTVLEGMRLFSSGDTVRQGQVLVSGFEDYGLCLKAVQAEGEIYAKTWHSGTVISPAVYSKKCYTGREWTEYIWIIGRKRINLFGNSGIYPVSCDKIIDEHILSLPNLDFPLRLQVVTYREYTLTEETAAPEAACASLEAAWQRTLQEQMVAGEILETESTFLCMDSYYILHTRSVCNEMIAKAVPVEEIYKGESYE